jgi:Mce-associated membrane protein
MAAHRTIDVTLTAVLVALLAASTWLWLDQGTSLDERAAATARQQTLNFFGLDYGHADKDLDAVIALATGSFKSEYIAKRGALKESLVAKKVVMTSEVPEDGTAVEFETETEAQVLVAVDVTTNGSTNRYRARVQLDKVDDRWLVSGLNQVG